MNITVIGCGETGATISALLLSKYNGIILNILDPDEGISGRILDLEHAATCNGSQIHWNDFDSASNSDYLFFTAGTRGVKGEDRSKKAKDNKELIASVFSQFKPKLNALIIIISNPTETMSLWVFNHLKGRNIVVGTGTGLDTFRLQTIISQRMNKAIHEINTLVLGEHGSTMTPIWSLTTIAGDAITDLVSQKQLDEFEVELKNSASEIRKTEVATKFGVAECALTILSSFLSPYKSKLVVSFPSKNIEQVASKDIFISWPCMIGNASISAVENVEMTESEMKHINKGIEAIKDTSTL